MVYVNDKKFACEACIKGHRSSNCQHTDRPLFEIKKKGRPVSQCEKCRELRKTKRMHSKCTCTPSEAGPSTQALASKASAEVGSAPKPKTRRFKAIAPALPNGIKDIMPPAAGPSSAASVNLCRCGGKEASVCTCGHERSVRPSLAANGGLAALAQAAMFCCAGEAPSVPLPQAAPVVMTAQVPPSTTILQDDSSQKRARGCCSSQPSSRPPSPKAKRSKHTSHAHPSSTSNDHTLPPLFPNPSLYVPDIHASSSSSTAPPAFPPIPPLSTITSYAAPECCCGTDCACPGCLKHRGEAHASADFEDCAEGTCGICVDNEGGVALPPPASTFAFIPASPAPQKSTSFIDAFFARAAALPPPPPSRTRPGALDPTNVLVYPRDLFSGEGGEGRKAAFGLVAVPKLECNCPGGCGCPEGRCACGDSCTGCGQDEGGEQEEQEESRARTAVGGCCG
ncbi:Metal-binding regulatory protein cuf1 [Trametes pubescens]|uniref:Metal-binding regulatory protein cuf1 n=1 Tax=Trametes pubescens TaxID=154538 RepID=A0A1M2VKA7_TRAPU|nr:Metal-binding regulatory protein cuf1 [Trametes pubescens]